MSPLSKELITKLANENDVEVLKEVLHYYAFLKEKKEQEIKKQWDSLEEVEPDEEELKIISEYKNSPEKFEFVSMEEVLKELGINESEL
ncbi:MAG: hypothetical protein ACH0QD_04740 [Tepidibacillus sp.]|uniref:Uncharacterized protein n=2 Tax=Tepidibacillus decaturensis TaxID=1413211 RepID=A0A135L774_9BACI|nr:hypothetical protein U473_12515 [Tepidibacillus decaturensis]